METKCALPVSPQWLCDNSCTFFKVVQKDVRMYGYTLLVPMDQKLHILRIYHDGIYITLVFLHSAHKKYENTKKKKLIVS